MIDIDDTLRRASVLAGNWSADAALEVAHGLGRSVAATIDWDNGAGETWIRLIKESQVVGLISTAFPIAFVVSEIGPEEAQHQGLLILALLAIDEPILRAEKGALSEAFGATARLDALNMDAFSAHDLWYATV